MRYIITGKYANGDDYGDATTDLAQLAYILSDIDRWRDNRDIGDNLKVLAETIKVETEEDTL